MDECERAKRELGPSGFVEHNTVWAEEAGVEVTTHKTKQGIILTIKSEHVTAKATIAHYRWLRLCEFKE